MRELPVNPLPAVLRMMRYGRWFGRELVRQFLRHRCMNAAAALTFTTLMAVVPLMTVTYFVLAAVPEIGGVRVAVENFLMRTFVPDASTALIRKFGEFSARATELGVVSVAILAVFAFFGLVRIEAAFNAIWEAPRPRTGSQRVLVYWAALSIGPPLLVVALLATSYLYALPLVMDLDAWGARERLLEWAPELALVAAFTLLYYAVPNTRVPIPHALAGGVVTTLLFQVAKWGFAVFVTQSTTALVYGAFAAAPFFLMWVYLVWILALGGAVFARVLSLSPAGGGKNPLPLLLQCARVIAPLRDAHARGEALAPAALATRAGLEDDARERVLRALAAEGLVTQTQDGRLTLGRSLANVTLLDLHRRLPESLVNAPSAPHADPVGVARRLRAVADCGERELNVSLETALADSATPPRTARANPAQSGRG